MIALLVLALLLRQETPHATPQQSPPPASGVQIGVRATPDTVTVGESFRLVVRVRAPRGAEIGFPVGPDSGLDVEAVDPRVVQRSPDTTAVDETALYRLVAWDTGTQVAHLGTVVVTVAGTDRQITIAGDRVYVRSVLPADTARQKPKPARDIVPAGRPWWIWLLVALAALALLGLLFWWWRRRRRRSVAPANVDAYDEARREFARIEAMALLDAGERGRYVALNVDTVRDYLAARVPAADRSLTSHELLHALRDTAVVPRERLAPVLEESDLVKFARRPITNARAAELAQEARAVVEQTERVVQAARAAAAAREAAA
jgi:hypothetical protein